MTSFEHGTVDSLQEDIAGVEVGANSSRVATSTCIRFEYKLALALLNFRFSTARSFRIPIEASISDDEVASTVGSSGSDGAGLQPYRRGAHAHLPNGRRGDQSQARGGITS